MRLFVNQTNRIHTDPVINKSTGDLLNGANVTVKLFQEDGTTLITGSNQTLTEEGSTGIYSVVLGVLAVVNKQKCKIELDIKQGLTSVWYFKGPLLAIIRDQF